MEKSSLIWLWGVNPAWTAIHQMPIIFKAMEQGAQVVCFDTHLTATAARCHQFVSVRPGTDGLLALALAKIILEEKFFDPNLVAYTLGHQEFFTYLREEINLEKAATVTGVTLETMHELAISYGSTHPACIWAGFGLQRYTNGGQTMRAIDALAALAGHIVEEGGGVQYGQFETWRFAGLLQNSDSGSTGTSTGPSTFNLNSSSSSNDTWIASTANRLLNINRFAREALDYENPPVKMLWLAGRNPFSQDADLDLWHRLVKQLDLIVINDLFLSRSSEADVLFLPVTTHYEHWDLNSSYWHY